MKRIVCLVCAVVMVFSLVGCQAAPNETDQGSEPAAVEPETPTDQGTAETSAPTTIDDSGVQRTLVLSKDPSEYKMCIYWPAPDTYFEDNIQPGYQQIEKEYGIHFEYVIGTEWTQDVENQMVEAKAAEGYDLFMIYGADTSGANALYKQLYEAGCQVVNYGGVMDDPQESPVTVCGDVYAYSYDATKKMIEAMGEGG